jgi:hypothetical protein
MYARVSAYDGTADDYDRGVAHVTSKAVPQVRAIPGSAGLLSMVDRKTGRSLSITLWDTEEALANSRDAADRIRSEAAAATGSTVTDVTEYEVGVADLT